MKWKRTSNFIIVVILSIAYAVIALFNLIGPLHMNATGGMNKPGVPAESGLYYLIIALLVTWGIYLYFQRKPETLFFLSIIVGIVFLIIGVFLWHIVGG